MAKILFKRTIPPALFFATILILFSRYETTIVAEKRISEKCILIRRIWFPEIRNSAIIKFQKNLQKLQSEASALYKLETDKYLPKKSGRSMINFHRRPGKYFWDAAQLSQRLTNFSADYSFVFAKYLSILLERENLQTLCPCSCHDSKSLEGEGQGVGTL